MKNDPNTAAQIAMKELSKGNPPIFDDPFEELSLNIPEMVLKLQAAGINVSSLDEDQWRAIFVAHGVDEEQATELLVDLASWGVTDEDEETDEG